MNTMSNRRWPGRIAGCLGAVLVMSLVIALGTRTGTGRGRSIEAEPIAGNCLSVPVIFSDGITLPLRGDEVPVFDGAFVLDEFGTAWFLQQDPLNEWQAGNVDAVAAELGPIAINMVDWGDNLEARDWTERDRVRVELVLWKFLDEVPVELDSFVMAYLDGEGPDEMWGTNTQTFPSPDATVYSGCARLVIQKLIEPDDGSEPIVLWDPVLRQWVLDAEAPVYSSAVYEGGDEGPTAAYSAEINVGGKVIYGYNWNVRNVSSGPGLYRLTFALDDLADGAPVALNTFFTEDTFVKVSEEEEAIAEEEPDEGDTGGGVGYIDVENNLTYIDVRIIAKGTGHGGGGGGPRR